MKKPFSKLKEKLEPYRMFMRSGRVAGIVLMLAACTMLSAGLVGGAYPALPLWSTYLIAAGLSVILMFLLALVLRIVFGTNTLSRPAFLMTFALLTLLMMMPDHAAHPVTVLLLSLILTLAADAAGRSVVGMIRVKKFYVSGLVTFLVSGVLIAGAVFAMLQKGFAENRIPAYTSLRTVSQAPSGFDKTMEYGKETVKTFTYGSGSGFDKESDPIDLSEMAERNPILGLGMKAYFKKDLDEAPVAGKIWYPADKQKCPTLFIVHGNHSYNVNSYEGYDYLCEYLASWGYVAVSVDENILNDLTEENDARAVLMLENMSQVLKWSTEDKSSPIYRIIDAENIAVAGHSRGGETAALTAQLRNYERYPENGNIMIYKPMSIKSVIAIAPTCDQYEPAGRTAQLTDVSYLLIHGSDDQDVYTTCGEKQYNNVHFTGRQDCFKSTLYILGANHGQFNSTWGDNDLGDPFGYFANRNAFISESDQKAILGVYVKTFLDNTLKGDMKYHDIFVNQEACSSALPETVIVQRYQDSDFDSLTDFDEITGFADYENVHVRVNNADLWTEKRMENGTAQDSSDFALYMEWDDESEVIANFAFNKTNLNTKNFSFAISDLRDKDIPRAYLDYTVTLKDDKGKTAVAENPVPVYPALGIQPGKLYSLWFDYEYKHPFTTVTVPQDAYKAEKGFNYAAVASAEVCIRNMQNGKIALNDVGFAANNAK